MENIVYPHRNWIEFSIRFSIRKLCEISFLASESELKAVEELNNRMNLSLTEQNETDLLIDEYAKQTEILLISSTSIKRETGEVNTIPNVFETNISSEQTKSNFYFKRFFDIMRFHGTWSFYSIQWEKCSAEAALLKLLQFPRLIGVKEMNLSLLGMWLMFQRAYRHLACRIRSH